MGLKDVNRWVGEEAGLCDDGTNAGYAGLE